jgi:hypothetical protein
VDLPTWPRPDARCSPGRMHCYAACRCDGRRKTVPGWSYSRVTGDGAGTSSWVFPVDAVRLRPCDDQVEVAAGQVAGLVARLRAAGRCGRPGLPVPFAIFDSGYAPAAVSWALRDTPVQVLVRLRDEGRRVFCAPPPPRRPGDKGRPPQHGQRRKLAEHAGWPPPDAELVVADSGRYGRVEVRAWHGLHQKVQARGYFAANPRRRGRHGPPGQGGEDARRHRPGPGPAAVVDRAARDPVRPGRDLAGLPAPVRRRARVPVREGNPGLDLRPAPHPGAGGPVDLAGHRRLYPAAPGPPVSAGPAPPLGAARPARQGPLPGPRPPRFPSHPRPPGHPRPRAETLPPRTRPTQGKHTRSTPRYEIEKKTGKAETGANHPTG